MGVACVADTHTAPEPSNLTVTEAYEAVHALCAPHLQWEINWMDLEGSIVRRFSRQTSYEAWMVATPVNEEGKRIPNIDRPMAVVWAEATESDALRVALAQLKREACNEKRA